MRSRAENIPVWYWSLNLSAPFFQVSTYPGHHGAHRETDSGRAPCLDSPFSLIPPGSQDTLHPASGRDLSREQFGSSARRELNDSLFCRVKGCAAAFVLHVLPFVRKAEG